MRGSVDREEAAVDERVGSNPITTVDFLVVSGRRGKIRDRLAGPGSELVKEPDVVLVE